MIKTILSIQLVRQLLGAAGGALIALTLFTVYREAKPMVRAYVLSGDEEAKDTKEAKEAKEFREVGMVANADVDIFDPDFALGADPVEAQIVTGPSVQPEIEPQQDASPLPVVTATAPALPSSGIGAGLILLIALFISVAIRKARQSRSLR